MVCSSTLKKLAFCVIPAIIQHDMGRNRCVFLCLSLLGISCNRSPQAYLVKGDKFAADHKYADASIQYRKAIQKDLKYGEAFYRLGLSELEQGNLREAYRAL